MHSFLPGNRGRRSSFMGKASKSFEVLSMRYKLPEVVGLCRLLEAVTEQCNLKMKAVIRFNSQNRN